MKMKSKITVTRLGYDVNNKKKNSQLKYWFLVILLIAILFLLTIKVEEYLRVIYSGTKYGESNIGTWLSSIASFWGAIIGGVIAGIISVVGIMITIRYYRNADYNNKMFENQPFINVTIKNTYMDEINKKLKDKRVIIYGDGKKTKYVNFHIENIGKNFARMSIYKHKYTNFGGISFNEIIKANEILDSDLIIQINYDEIDSIEFEFQFFDCFRNEYSQTYEIINIDNKEKININSNYPILIDSVFE